MQGSAQHFKPATYPAFLPGKPGERNTPPPERVVGPLGSTLSHRLEYRHKQRSASQPSLRRSFFPSTRLRTV